MTLPPQARGCPARRWIGGRTRRFTEAEQRAFRDELEGSGESVQAFARRIGVTVWTVYSLGSGNRPLKGDWRDMTFRFSGGGEAGRRML